MTRGLLKHGMVKTPGWGEVGDGVGHTTTRYGETENDARKKSLGVFYRNWHPGPMGFQVVADAIAWRLAVAGMDAADMLIRGDAVDDNAHAVPPASLGQGHCDNLNRQSDDDEKVPVFHTECVKTFHSCAALRLLRTTFVGLHRTVRAHNHISLLLRSDLYVPLIGRTHNYAALERSHSLNRCAQIRHSHSHVQTHAFAHTAQVLHGQRTADMHQPRASNLWNTRGADRNVAGQRQPHGIAYRGQG
jgi:hypothetical protein